MTPPLAGALGRAQALDEHPQLAQALALIDVVYLASYAWQTLVRTRQSNQLQTEGSGTSLRMSHAIARAAAFTLLNPHVNLDTVLLVGSIGAQQPSAAKAIQRRGRKPGGCLSRAWRNFRRTQTSSTNSGHGWELTFNSVSKSIVSRREAAGSADARQGEATTTRMIWKRNKSQICLFHSGRSLMASTVG